ncbi:CdaR family protein [Spirochaeta lutea]|uniref:YbbR-like protein n=1 Tax=Spirochaeta lutea TaxID=1480694 RepID=A0A098R2D0_9SPIO|nr:CdaR family protein [Spirochaeta lutea]KGE72832.1 hypothetical protein DC28_05535 [Spirochaeta lutea]
MSKKRLSSRISRIFQNWPAKILSLAAAVLLYTLTGINTLDERHITIPVDVPVPAGLALVGQSVQKVQVQIRGDSERVWDIGEQDIQIGVDMSEIRAAGIYRRPLVITKRGNALGVDPLELTLGYEQVEVELQEYLEKTLPVIPRFTGQPAPGYQLGTTGVSPGDVRVGGPRGVLEPVQRLETASVDLSGRTGSFTQRVEILLPDERLAFSDQATVEVRGTVSESVILTSFEDVDVIVLDPPRGLQLSEIPEPGSIRVQGSQVLIERTTPDQVRLLADARTVPRPGTYRLQVRPEVPRGLLILGYTPQEVELEFQTPPVENPDNAGTETPDGSDVPGGENLP